MPRRRRRGADRRRRAPWPPLRARARRPPTTSCRPGACRSPTPGAAPAQAAGVRRREIDALVAYVGSLGDGPRAARTVDLDGADLAARRRAVPGQLPGLPQRPAPAARSATAGPRRPRAGRAAAGRGGGPRRPGQMPVFGADVLIRRGGRRRRRATSSTSTTRATRRPPHRPHRPDPRGLRGLVRRHGRAARLVAWIGTAAIAGGRGERDADERPRPGPSALLPRRRRCRRSGSPSSTGRAARPSRGRAAGAVTRRHRRRHRRRGPRRTCPSEEVTEERGRARRRPRRRSRPSPPSFEAGERARHRGRRLLLGSLGAAFAALGAALLFPIRSLGPDAGRGLQAHAVRRPRRAGSCARTASPIRLDDLPVDGVAHRRAPRATPTPPTRRRCSSGRAPTGTSRPAPGREDWTVDGIVAYSKLCTHVGCPVGLYQAEDGLLLCPCHQSTFDVLRRGPARVRPRGPVAAAAAARRRRRRLPRSPPATSPARSAPASGTGTVSDADRASPRWLDERLGAASFARTALEQGLPRPLVVHARRARPLLLRRAGAHRRLPHVLLRPEPERGRLRRQLRAAARRRDDRGLPVGARPELRRAGRAGDAPDPPLGGAAVPRRHRRAPRPGVLHRRLPPAARAQLDRRRARCWSSPSSTASPATRCSTTSCRAPACASPTRSRCRSRSSGRGWRRSSSAASSPAPTSSAGSTSSTSCSSRPLIAVLLGAAPGDRRAPQAHAVPGPGPRGGQRRRRAACGRPTRPRPSACSS